LKRFQSTSESRLRLKRRLRLKKTPVSHLAQTQATTKVTTRRLKRQTQQMMQVTMRRRKRKSLQQTLVRRRRRSRNKSLQARLRILKKKYMTM